MGSVRGGEVFLARMRRMASAGAVREVDRALYAAGNLIEVEAERSITDGAVSGAGHVPSSPGEPPNADTHALDRQIETERVSPGRVNVVSRDPKSSWLEWGTSNMEERPFMRPAATKMKRKAQELITAVMRRLARGG